MDIRQRIEAFLRERGMTPTRFGEEALNDRRLVFDLRRGRELRPRTRERLLAWIDAQTGREP